MKTLRIGHSPDPDDAFMWWPLANFTGPDGRRYTPQIDTRGYEFEHVIEDIQSLNVRSDQAELEITALSIHQYPFIADRYALTTCGSSMGDGYGPMIVAPADRKLSLKDLKDARLAIPGERTTAWLALQIALAEQGVKPGNHEVVMFDQIIPRVAAGEFDAGLIIHEGQLTYRDAGLDCLIDLGAWWGETRELPLPLGGNAIRRDVGTRDELANICGILLDSIQYALSNRDDAVTFALQYARDMGGDLADEFVGMYVNDWTLDYGDRGRAAVAKLLSEGAAAGLTPPPPAEQDMFIAPAVHGTR